MTGRPIIFSAAMVRAWLDGRKTMTRRLAWGKGKPDGLAPAGITYRATSWQNVTIGDRLWVRESSFGAGWSPSGDYDWFAVCYSADEKCSVMRVAQTGIHAPYKLKRKLTPSIHMPRWASRLTLVVTATKIERLQDISEEDARAEGAEPRMAGHDASGPLKTYRTGFVHLWRSLHGDGAWLSNPEVIAITAIAHRSNIDAMPKTAAA